MPPLMYIIAETFAPNEAEFRAKLTPDNALHELELHNQSWGIRTAAQYANKLRLEWLLNGFQFAAQVVSSDHVLDMATYINNSSILNRVAPRFYGSTVWAHIFHHLFRKCPPEKRPYLLGLLEERGHMQGVINKNGTSSVETGLFYDEITESFSVEDSILFLRRSPSFDIAKVKKNFVLETIQRYPQYKAPPL